MLLANRSWGAPSDPVALLVHGARDASTTWHRVGPWFGDRGWHAIAVDLRGHGESQTDPNTSDRLISTMAEDLVETVAGLRPDVEGVDVLVGHSLGTLVSLVCLTEHPTFARRVVLEDPPGESLDFSLTAELLREKIQAARSNPAAMADEMAGAEDSFSRDEILAKVNASAAADLVYLPELVAGLAQQIDLVDLAKRCPMPALVVLGRDTGVPGRNGHDGYEDRKRFSAMCGEDRVRFCSALRRRSVVELEVGHDIHEPVFDDFVAQLDTWLAETDQHAA